METHVKTYERCCPSCGQTTELIQYNPELEDLPSLPMSFCSLQCEIDYSPVEEFNPLDHFTGEED